MNSTCGLIVNSSRGIIYVDKTEKLQKLPAPPHKKCKHKWLNNSKQFSEKGKRISKENECLTKRKDN